MFINIVDMQIITKIIFVLRNKQINGYFDTLIISSTFVSI